MIRFPKLGYTTLIMNNSLFQWTFFISISAVQYFIWVWQIIFDALFLVFDNPKAPSTYEDINGLKKDINKSNDVIKKSPYEV